MKYFLCILMIIFGANAAQACSIIPTPGKNFEKENFDRANLILKIEVVDNHPIKNKINLYLKNYTETLTARVIKVIKNTDNIKIGDEIDIEQSSVRSSCDAYLELNKVGTYAFVLKENGAFILPIWPEQIFSKGIK